LRSVHRSGVVGGRLSDKSVALIVKRHVTKLRLDGGRRVLFDEVVALGYDRSYPNFARQLR
jgi:hypothetical protein